MFEDIFLPRTGLDGDDEALTAAVTLARACQVHLKVMELVALPSPSAMAWGPPADFTIGELYQQLQAQGEANVVKLNARLRAEDISYEVCLAQALYGTPALVAAQHALYTDLSVISGVGGDTAEGDLGRAYFGGLLIKSGRPVLVVPKGSSATLPPSTVLVAWTPTREASRALHDALPLMRTAKSVHMVVVYKDGDGRVENHGVDEVTKHLARHGVMVQTQIRKKGDDKISERILEQASFVGADMLVAGGFGRSRFREWAFGGVTRELLRDATLPVFYAH